MSTALALLLVGIGLTSAGADPASSAAAEQAFEQGRFGQALTQWKAALPTLPAPERIDALLAMAAAYQAIGQAKNAFESLQEARALAESSGDQARQALVLGRLSDIHLIFRRLDEAERDAEQSVNLARPLHNRTVLAVALNHQGNVLMAQREYPNALQAYRESLNLAGQDPKVAAEVAINALHAHLAGNTSEAARPILETALSHARASPDSYSKALDLLALGYLAQRLAASSPAQGVQLRQQAYQADTQALKLAEALADPRLLSQASGQLGELYAQARRDQEAEAFLQRALFFAQQSRTPEDLLARWYWQLGRLFKARDQPEPAKAAYQQAIEQLNKIQSALVLGQRGDPQFFRQTVGAVYLDLADLLLKEAGDATSEAHRHDLLREVRTAMEGFKTAELKNYFQDECVTAYQGANRVEQLDRLMQPGTATLYPILFPERTVLLLSLAGDAIQQVVLPVGAQTLRHTTEKLRAQLVRPDDQKLLLPHAKQLYDWLIKPISAVLEAHAVHTLVVVPDDFLRTIPFAALHDGHRFLIDRYALAITPGLTLTNPNVFVQGERRALLNGLSEKVQGFPQLRFVKDEIKGIAPLYNSVALLDQNFQKTAVRTELARTPYSFVVFSTHGQFLGDPRQSFLLAYDGKIMLDELDEVMRIGQFRDQPVELVVLSACQTAEGDERAALGLAGAAVKAGVSSVVASLWIVDDESTAKLMPKFFENLKDPALSKAQALRKAQLYLLAQDSYKHPYYWSPFVLIGNWY